MFWLRAGLFLVLITLLMNFTGGVNWLHLALCALCLLAGRYHSDHREQTAW